MHWAPDSAGTRLREANDCHNPAGSSEGGRFCDEDGVPSRGSKAARNDGGFALMGRGRFSADQYTDARHLAQSKANDSGADYAVRKMRNGVNGKDEFVVSRASRNDSDYARYEIVTPDAPRGSKALRDRVDKIPASKRLDYAGNRADKVAGYDPKQPNKRAAAPPVVETPAAADLPRPKAKLRAALPELGFTLRGDFATIYNRLYLDAQRVAKRAPTQHEMVSVVDGWIDWSRMIRKANRGGRSGEVRQVIQRALKAHK